MEVLKQKTLGLFLTRGNSLRDWHSLGILSRELAVYNELAAYFGRVRIFTYGGAGDLEFSGSMAANISVHPLGLKLPKFIRMFLIPLRLSGAVRGCHFLKSNQMFGAFGAVFAGMLYRKPVIVRTGYTLTKFVAKERISFFKKALGRLEEWACYKSRPFFIVSSRHDFEYVTSKYAMDPSRGLIVPNYIDTSVFRPLAAAKNRDVIFVGRLSAQKNLPALLEALAGTGLKATIVGKGELEAPLKEQALKAGLDMEWIPSVKNADLPSLLDSHRFFILPSHYEGMPKTLLEAMGCGMAVIGTDVEGIGEVIEDGKDGLLCGTASTSIRAALLRLAASADLRADLGRAARAKIEASYSLKGLVEKEAAFYRESLCAP